MEKTAITKDICELKTKKIHDSIIAVKTELGAIIEGHNKMR